MRVSVLVGCVAGLVTVAMAGDVLTCGDKYLVLGRGTRFERGAHARVPAAVLLLANPSSPVGKAFADMEVAAVLQRAGYRPRAAGSVSEADRALREGGVDVVLVDLADTAAVADHLSGVGHPPVLVPTVYNPTGAELKQLRQRYGCVLKSPSGRESLLDTVDDAISLRGKTRQASGSSSERH
jgi:hypothetical protein